MSVKEEEINEGRRRFMMSGALVVSFSLFPGVSAMAQEVIADEGAAVHIGKATQALAGSLKTNPYLDAWIKIDAAGKVTVYTARWNWARACVPRCCKSPPKSWIWRRRSSLS